MKREIRKWVLQQTLAAGLSRQEERFKALGLLHRGLRRSGLGAVANLSMPRRGATIFQSMPALRVCKAFALAN
jgi:hypothetical protein